MKLSTILGFIIGFGIIIIGIANQDTIVDFINLPAMLIVLGGTLAAILISFSSTAIFDAITSFSAIFTASSCSPRNAIEIVVNLSKAARTSSFESLLQNKDVKRVPILERGLSLIAEDVKAERIEVILTRESKAVSDRNRTGERVFRVAGSFAPMFGIIGTVIGLVVMINQGLEAFDPGEITMSMALALLSTFYGLLLTALLFRPLSSKIRDNNHTNNKVNEIIIEGVLSIQKGENSQITREKLLSYLY
ncbi:MAG: MotA/TolQ/ExbB proton channel family protein [Candidatus Cloacimonetes bacterium]|nr:MotA/TolQ/ExbB proton channel family protein [Candidatus Cloacimonadota bacterium]